MNVQLCILLHVIEVKILKKWEQLKITYKINIKKHYLSAFFSALNNSLIYRKTPKNNK